MDAKHSLTEQAFSELLRRARAGDRQALDELFKGSRRALGEHATRQVGGKHPGISRPSDLAQDAALLAYNKFDTFTGSTQPQWQAWLRSILRNRTAQAFRDAGRQKREAPGTVPLDSSEAQVPATQTTASQVTAHNEEWRQILIYIYRLPDAQQKAVWLCHLEEMPITEVARLMRKTEAAVAGLLQRGLKNLRRQAENSQVASQGGDEDVPAAGNQAASALLDFVRRRDDGEHVDMEQFLNTHASCAAELGPMLQWIIRIQSIRTLTQDS